MGSGKKSHEPHEFKNSSIPRGIEVLVKKASVDPGFRKLLLDNRAEAAKEIDLELNQNEIDMLAAISYGQLEKIIDNTKVPPEQEKVFLGSIGRIMLMTVVAGTIVTCTLLPSLGHSRTLSPEQRERILQRQMELERIMYDMNDPNEVDLEAEKDSNG
jgi:hypothetical protein